MLCIQSGDTLPELSRQNTEQSSVSTLGQDSLTEPGPSSTGYDLSQLKISGDTDKSVSHLDLLLKLQNWRKLFPLSQLTCHCQSS